MKKFATIVMMIAVMAMMAIPVLASQPDYPLNSHKHKQYDTDQKFREWEERLSERWTAFEYKVHGLMLNWYIESLDNHQHVIARRCPQKAVYGLHTNRIDFIEFGKLYQAESEDEIEAVKQDFEKDPVDASLRFIFPIEASESEGFEEHTAELRQEIVEKKIPIYWDIKTMTWDTNFYVVEVAIGKYVIKEGDTLSQIAEQFDTSVDEIMENNKNIENPDIIYAGNYLCIW